MVVMIAVMVMVVMVMRMMTMMVPPHVSLLDETSSARVRALNSSPGIGEGGAHLGMLIEAAIA
jgi:hypothetical protein